MDRPARRLKPTSRVGAENHPALHLLPPRPPSLAASVGLPPAQDPHRPQPVPQHALLQGDQRCFEPRAWVEQSGVGAGRQPPRAGASFAGVLGGRGWGHIWGRGR